LRADKPPDLVKIELPCGTVGQVKVALMRRIEGSAEQPDSQSPVVMKQPWYKVPP